MKNIINITTQGEQLVSSTDDGTNTLYINDNQIPSSSWIGSGNYTDTVNGHAITIKKCTDLNGNCQLVKLSDYNYEMRKTALAGQLQMLNYIYPVGSYYETSDADFDPNTAWGGTWTSEQIEDDYVVDEINNGTWIGRKWASGKLELYIYYSGVPTGGKHYWTSASNVLRGYRVEGFVFPQGWKPLNTTYNVTVNWHIGSGFCMDSTYGGDANGFNIYALATQADVTNVQAKVLVTGYWKSFGSPTKYRWHRTA